MYDQMLTIAMKLSIIFSVITFLTIGITQVIKLTFEIKGTKNLNILATFVSLVLSVLSYLTYISYCHMPFIWYYLLGAILAGFIVALAAMQGWDKVFAIWKTSKVDSRIKQSVDENIYELKKGDKHATKYKGDDR